MIATALSACTLLTSAGDLREAPDTDAGVDAAEWSEGAPPPPAPDTDAAGITDGCFDVPPQFFVVAFGQTGKGVPCPEGFGLLRDTVEGPTVSADACTCSCSVTRQPTCQQGEILGFFGLAGQGTCPQMGAAFANNGCGTDGYLGPFGPGNEHRHVPPGPSGGTCSARVNEDDSKLTFAAEGRVCIAANPSPGRACLPPVAEPFRACIAAQGDVACPAPFTQKTLVGFSATFTCPTTGCTCSVNATCTGGRLNFYSTTNCTGGVQFSYEVNDSCVPSVADGATFSSYRYVANPPTNVRCETAGTPMPSAPQLLQPMTICCG